ncbi:MAG: thiamine pyrophosphate-binding protein [SAR202 cluster bacterium]|nr:thiamine pyrophosphate-binding protein [SAR202 cluster bacterium]
MIPCLDAVKALIALRKDQIVVPTMTPNRYWTKLSTNKDMDLPIFGGMGKASSVALGLAMAQPGKQVICIDGDGSLLMNLGSLVTIAGMKPKNLVHIVFDDRAYHTTGGQPVPGADVYNFKVMAEGAGYKNSYQFDNLEDWVSELPKILKQQGPTFVSLQIHYPDGGPEFFMASTREPAKRMREVLTKGK